jgi:hypothetical protein
MTAAVTATLNAGAEPATPITVDSMVPKEPVARLLLSSAMRFSLLRFLLEHKEIEANGGIVGLRTNESAMRPRLQGD